MIFRDGLSSLNVPEAFVCAVEPALTDSSYFQVPLNVWYRPFLIHLLAEAVGRQREPSGRQENSQIRALVAAAVTAESNLHILSGLGTGMTPLMHALYGAMASDNYLDCWRAPHVVLANRMHAALRDWINMLYEAGVSLVRYGKKEAKLFSQQWRTSQGVFWRLCNQHVKVYQIKYGANPSDWHLWVAHAGDCYAGEFWDMLEHPERTLPGAWIDDEETRAVFDPDPSKHRESWVLNKNIRAEACDYQRFPD